MQQRNSARRRRTGKRAKLLARVVRLDEDAQAEPRAAPRVDEAAHGQHERGHVEHVLGVALEERAAALGQHKVALHVDDQERSTHSLCDVVDCASFHFRANGKEANERSMRPRPTRRRVNSGSTLTDAIRFDSMRAEAATERAESGEQSTTTTQRRERRSETRLTRNLQLRGGRRRVAPVRVLRKAVDVSVRSEMARARVGRPDEP